MKKYIAINAKDREFLCKVFGVVGRTIQNAASYFDGGKNVLHERIRRAAFARGCVVMYRCNELECIHSGDGYMRQYLNNGDTVLEFSYSEGSCEVWHRGDFVHRFKDVKVDQIPYIQQYALRLGENEMVCSSPASGKAVALREH